MGEDFYGKLDELYPLYEKVKLSILLAENFDEKREMYVAPLNQLRSALDHIFKAVHIAQKTESFDYELKEAKEHMERAGYDALELLAGNLGISVIKKLQPYDTKTLTNVFHEYYTKVKPKIIEIQQSVTQRRMERKIDSEKSFLAYFEEITELVEINTVDRMIPSLQEFSNKKKNEKRRDTLWKVIIGLISVIVGYLLSKIKWSCV